MRVFLVASLTVPSVLLLVPSTFASGLASILLVLSALPNRIRAMSMALLSGHFALFWHGQRPPRTAVGAAAAQPGGAPTAVAPRRRDAPAAEEPANAGAG